MDIVITNTKLRFKNPETGGVTRSTKDHYNGRRIFAEVDGEEQSFRFKKDELPFEATEEDMEKVIEERLKEKEDED
ncbi:hypothetical protein [Salsuginibacillus kocurii]|uniref:hypothetical protein n=1 Tax=Salsuginibacillus kocurii TaxID=427078 RepID=UPI00035EABBC|nr:hypothetical protein [Salsuginibacillus kocurii]